MTRALVLFSGGLDSRLVVKLLQEQNIEVIAINFRLPFLGGCCSDEKDIIDFSKRHKIKLNIIDCTKGRYLKEYLRLIKKPKHGFGKSANPCIDCRIFTLKKAKSLMKRFRCDFIATGEVLNERPMSQHKKAMEIIDKEAGLKNKVLRPLSAKLLEETEPEKKDIIIRKKLLALSGRNRRPQIALAEKYKITYPHPAGGCILCEKQYPKKINDILQNTPIKDITYEHLLSLKGFRHFRAKGKIILGRSHDENIKLKRLNKKIKYNIYISKKPGPTALYEDKKDKVLIMQLIEAYSSKDIKERKRFDKFLI